MRLAKKVERLREQLNGGMRGLHEEMYRVDLRVERVIERVHRLQRRMDGLEGLPPGPIQPVVQTDTTTLIRTAEHKIEQIIIRLERLEAEQTDFRANKQVLTEEIKALERRWTDHMGRCVFLEYHIGHYERRFGDLERFAARFEERFHWIRTELQRNSWRFTRLENQFNERFARIDERFTRIDEQFNKIDQRFVRIEVRLDRMEERFADIYARLTDLHEALNRQTRWLLTAMFGFFSTAAGLVVTFMVRYGPALEELRKGLGK